MKTNVLKVVIKSLVISGIMLSTVEAAADALPTKKTTHFTQGFATIKKTCPLFERPAANQVAAYLAQGKKIWLTAVDSQWLVATTKVSAKEFYLPQTCIN